MDNHLGLLEKVLNFGAVRPGPDGLPARSMFAESLVFDLQRGFPLSTTKQMNFEAIVARLVSLCLGKSSHPAALKLAANPAVAFDVPTPAIDGYQWRNRDSTVLLRLEEADFTAQVDAHAAAGYQFQGSYTAPVDSSKGLGTTAVMHKNIDQLQQLITTLRDTPYAQSAVASWAPSAVDQMLAAGIDNVLHCYVQDNFIHMQVVLARADVYNQVPVEIALYAALMHVVAGLAQKLPGRLHLQIGEAYMPLANSSQARAQLRRTPRGRPSLSMRDLRCIDDLTPQHFILRHYRAPVIPAT